MSGFDRLHPAIQHHVVNSLGWRSLRPLQEQSIVPLLAGRDALLIAPTAGGKTEAAIFPLFSRMLEEGWQGLSILYVCPIKALLNNLEHRLRRYAELVGRRVALWHGDVGPSERKRIDRDPPDLLLTTPESIEVILTSMLRDHERIFAGLRVIVVDELHAFAGDDRGWHLQFLMERLEGAIHRKLQRVGLSATVGNPEELLDSFSTRPSE
ncbi:MAG TPA: DEAD/DEAH box helicase, partial [Planctomycetota bacterium]|nr:DEAD/DEAH box helicase [Planctomycetota bacterium]